MRKKELILAINGGSSSIKFALFESATSLTEILNGVVENIGSSKTVFSFNNIVTGETNSVCVKTLDHTAAALIIINFLKGQSSFTALKAIGHRIVYGMQHTAPEKITSLLLDELKKISEYDPEHLPEEIILIELFTQYYPETMQVACFDTAFHTTMPAVAKMLGIPRKYFNKGIQRYGFHGLSYAYLMEELKNIAGEEAVKDRIILAHLGSGASLAAVKNGKSVDTTMGFTPASGLPMGTRSGDIDPGVAWYLMKFEKLTPEQFSHLINHESGLLGISETSADIRQLQELEKADSRAAEAIEFFCYQTKKWIGSYAAVLNGLDTLVFSGGIGEHSPEVRSKICNGFLFLGIELDEIKNMNNAAIVSTDASKVTVHIIKTNEELMMAKLVCKLMNKK